MSGTEVCRQLRQSSQVPIIMLTAKDGEIDKVVGLELGADDYVTKPFSSRELLARIRAVLRRHGEPDELLPPTRRGGSGADGRRPARRDACAARRCQLPLKEFDLLELLLRNSGRVLTRGQLIDRVWGTDYVGDTKTLDVHVKRLRAKIEADPANPGTWSPCAAWATSSRPSAGLSPARWSGGRVRRDPLVVADRRHRAAPTCRLPGILEGRAGRGRTWPRLRRGRRR